MLNKIINAAFLLATVSILSSCASIFGSTHYPVSINSNPQGANVTITDKKGKIIYNGQSPAKVTLKSSAGYFSNASYKVKFSLPGYQDQTVNIKATINGWYFGNLFFGGALGMLIIDPATGCMWRIADKNINTNLAKSVTSLEGSTLNIVDLASLPENMKSHLMRLK